MIQFCFHYPQAPRGMAHNHTFSRSPQYPSRRSRSRRGFRLWKLLVTLSPLLLPFAWFGYRELENTWVEPQAIFVLGGETGREKFAAQFAREHPDLPVWISGGAPKGYTNRVFDKARVDKKNLHLDYQASDTVTNFTTLVDRFEAQGIDCVYLVTSDDHMQRARTIGEIVFGSRGIKIKPVTFESHRESEPTRKIVRDGIRSLVWWATGYSG
jgi:uncharacterized SAM-binding protein YcdF (DUF218 family)